MAVQPYFKWIPNKKNNNKNNETFFRSILKKLFVNRTIFKLFISFQVAATTAAQKSLENPQG